MHAQMLARYSAELVCAGLPQVVAFDNYREIIAEGYDPGAQTFLKFDGTPISIGVRPDNMSLADIKTPTFSDRPGAKISSQEFFRDRLIETANSKSDRTVYSYSNFAELVEATHRAETKYFGALHNDGHILMSLYHNDERTPHALFYEATSMRDPLFYRWHAHIDSIFNAFRSGLPPHDFLDLPRIYAESIKVFTPSHGRRNEVYTDIISGQVVLQNKAFDLPQMICVHDYEFEIELRNFNDIDIPVIIRIFICPEGKINFESSWIEMDKFFHLVPAASRLSISQCGFDSSVVWHPAINRDVLERRVTWPSSQGKSSDCKCGWPYHLMMPSGNAQGEEFRVMVILTPGSDIAAPLQNKLQGTSYCGSSGGKYPDRRPMGYPFDRPLSVKIKDWLDTGSKPQQVASSKFTIWNT